MESTFSANGKLLLSGEYVIIDGALSLALPTSRGQHLTVAYTTDQLICWNSFDVHKECWFSVEFDALLAIKKTTDNEKATLLKNLLLHCLAHTSKEKADQFIGGVTLSSFLDFPRDWGLGSSSTLLVLLSKLFEVDAFKLHFSQTNGSGYDIACGIHDTPITYLLTSPQMPIIEKVDFHPIFSNRIYFIHLNQKQISTKEVAGYNQLKKEYDIVPIIKAVSECTQRLLTCQSLTVFESILESHETIISHVLQRNTIRESKFQLYNKGVVKSLGAWGGDFILATGDDTGMDYFRDQGYATILPYDEMVK
jgi:mevalonate kinase